MTNNNTPPNTHTRPHIKLNLLSSAATGNSGSGGSGGGSGGSGGRRRSSGRRNHPEAPLHHYHHFIRETPPRPIPTAIAGPPTIAQTATALATAATAVEAAAAAAAAAAAVCTCESSRHLPHAIYRCKLCPRAECAVERFNIEFGGLPPALEALLPRAGNAAAAGPGCRFHKQRCIPEDVWPPPHDRWLAPQARACRWCSKQLWAWCGTCGNRLCADCTRAECEREPAIDGIRRVRHRGVEARRGLETAREKWHGIYTA